MTLATAAAQLADIEAALHDATTSTPALYTYQDDELARVWTGPLAGRDDVSLILEWAERIGPADGCVFTAPIEYRRGVDTRPALVVYATGNDGLPAYCALVTADGVETLEPSPILGRLALILATVAVKETP